MDPALLISIVVAVVAVYGAILSTLNFRAQRRSRRPAVTVKVSNGMFVWGPRLSELQLMIEAVNTGEVPVMLSSFGFRLRDGRSIALINPTMHTVDHFPHELLPHCGVTVGEDFPVIAETLARANIVGRVRLIGFYTDQEGNEYRAEPCDFDVSEWLGRRAG
jgi:hypothetical protein